MLDSPSHQLCATVLSYPPRFCSPPFPGPLWPAAVSIFLASADGFVPAQVFGADVVADGTFALRQVLPGKYWAAVIVDSDGSTKWATRKVEVNVDGNVSDLNLELFAR